MIFIDTARQTRTCIKYLPAVCSEWPRPFASPHNVQSRAETTRFIEHGTLFAETREGRASIEFGYYSPGLVKLRRQCGNKPFNLFDENNKALARLKLSLIENYEKWVHENARRPTRSELKILLSDWHKEAVSNLIAKGRIGKKRSNTVVKIKISRDAPTDRTFLDYYNHYLDCGRDARALLWYHHGPGKNHRLHNVDPESLGIWMKFAQRFADRNRPTMSMLRADCKAEIAKQNEGRKAEGRADFLTPPTRGRFERIVQSMDAYYVMAARFGLPKALATYRAQMRGFDIERPGQRVEFDFYTLDLQVWLTAAELWEKLNPESKTKLASTRIHLSMARDAATGYVPAIKAAVSETSRVVIETLDMALSDKCHIARFVGAETGWYGGISFESAVSDNGSAYIADETYDTFLASGIGLTHPAAGQPWHRGFIESLFFIIAKNFLNWFLGRTFSNPVEKGDHPSEELASLTAEEAVALIIRMMLDYYHHVPNPRTGRSPHDAWVDYLEL